MEYIKNVLMELFNELLEIETLYFTSELDHEYYKEATLRHEDWLIFLKSSLDLFERPEIKKSFEKMIFNRHDFRAFNNI